MNTHTSTSSAQASNSLRGWLTAPVPISAFQANIQQLRLSRFKLMANTSAVFGLAVIVLLVLVAIFAPLIATHDIGANNLANRLQPPSWGHFFGTDELGRDIFSRLVYGSRITLYIVTLTAVIAAPIGLVVGTTAGYMGGWVDTALMRIVDIFLAFPSLVLALSFAAALGRCIENAVIAISLAAWPPIARLARAETLTIRSSDYVAAIRLQGLPRCG